MDALGDMVGKYFDLVWYARSGCDRTVPADIAAGCLIKQHEVEEEYPKEVAELCDPGRGDWEHGFNSGALAMARYVLTLFESGRDAADDEFPMLDT